MKKSYLFLMIPNLIAPLSISTTPILNNISSLNIKKEINNHFSDNFVEMENGDFSLNGIGSVTSELEEYDIDIWKYLTGQMGDSPLMIAETNDKVYLYIYNENGNLYFDKASVAYYEGPLKDWNKEAKYHEFDLTLVSFNETNQLGKFLIEGLSTNMNNDHLILVRQIYDEVHANNQKFIQGIGLNYQYSAKLRKSKITTEETIKVTNKLVSYELYPFSKGNNQDGVYQRSYVAFSTDRKMEDLLKVKLKYDYYTYSGYTDIPLNYSSTYWKGNKSYQNFAESLENKDIKNSIQKDVFYNESETVQDYIDTIQNETIEIEYKYENDRWFYFNAKDIEESFVYNTIQDTSSLNKDNLINYDILDYDWIVTFDNRLVDCFIYLKSTGWWLWEKSSPASNIFVGTINNDRELYYLSLIDNFTEQQFLEELIHYDLPESTTREEFKEFIKKLDDFPRTDSLFTYENLDNEQIKDEYKKTYEESNPMLQVEDLTLLEFTYKNDLEEHHAITIDTYTDMGGGSQFGDNDVSTNIEKWWNNVTGWFSDIFGKDTPFMKFLKILSIVLGGGLIILLIAWFINKIIKMFKSNKSNKK